MRILNFLLLLTLCFSVTLGALAEGLQPVDLKAFVGASPFQNINADYLLPRGRQVIDGTPFQIDGVIFVKGGKAASASTNSRVIPVGRSFEKLHLLVSGQTKSPEGTAVGKIHLLYTDGTEADVELRFGDHIRNWYGPWHKAEPPLGDSNSRVSWIAQFSAAATTDDYLRLFHVILNNPSPDKEVRSFTLKSTGKPTSLMFIAISVGPAKVEPLLDTIHLPKNPFPDLRPRNGDLVRGEGMVKSRDGSPIAGAHVVVSGVRQFEEGYSESSMDAPAVSQESTTDSGGKFVLPPLPDNRFYRLFISADGFASTTYGGMDPKSDPIEIRLNASTNAAATSKFMASAKVVDMDGKPISFAIVEPDGVGDGNGSYWGSGEGFPEQLMTDKNGEVVLSRKDHFEKVRITVHAPNLAPAKVWLDATNQMTTVEMGVGGIIAGRVVKDGQPLAGIRIGVTGSDRNSMHDVGNYYTKTDSNGVFNLTHLPPNTKWWLSGTMSSLKTNGAIQPTMVESGSHGASNNVGDMQVIKGLTLSGTVKTLHGEPLPKSVAIQLGYDLFADYQSAKVDSDGRFRFDGLHKGEADISLSTQGWRFGGNMRSEDFWNPWRLVGLIENDKNDLLLVIEKGNIDYNSNSSNNGQIPSTDMPQNRPIAGAEPSAGPPAIILAGKVVDDKTGLALPVVRITPGRKPPIVSTGTPAPKPLLEQVLEPLKTKTIPWNERPYWQFNRKGSFTNSNFAVEFFPLTSSPILRVEADGYEPIETEPVTVTTSNLVIRSNRARVPMALCFFRTANQHPAPPFFMQCSRNNLV
ncbi:carboxypeptidase regulatory-like domain-containing protein [Pedosphaera parvula]|uniref:Carboxypeptidase regulatory-like domain-containing protein n=1 Tax=Pedosphaera parvula (strain Ellin514) TaxID=320771 RepID=B9XLE4_PEDPL|nr:carboxypeptidase regulatory-like domain-containing protein [Pedosphaera parvula]EEF59347.1 hypothetical protein Cflav_PD1895 [Pedosphaera parvula Ellin514]